LIVKIEGTKLIKRSNKGSFTILSYNEGSCSANNARLISEKLNKYDVVNLQEDFFHDKEITSKLKFPYRTQFPGSNGDGMMTFTIFPLYTTTRIDWKNSHGFCYSAIEVSPGFVVDIYNIYADSDIYNQSRRSNWIELANYINTRSAGKSVIVFGYTNARYSIYGDDFEQLVLKPCNLKDAWVQNVMGGIPPAKGSAPLYENQYGQKGEVVDKIWYRSGKDLDINAANFEILFNEFTDKNNRQLSAHYPITARIDYEYKGTYLTTNTFGGGGGQGFSFLEQMNGRLPRNIIIASGDRIDRVGFTYDDGPIIVGGKGGKVNVYEFASGEYIVSMRIGKSTKSSFSTKRISYILFTTNMGGKFSAGKPAKEVKDFIAPGGYAIAGFIGSASSEIDRLGVIYLKVY